MPTNFKRHARLPDYDARKPKFAPRSAILPPSHGPRDAARSGFTITMLAVLFTVFIILLLLNTLP